MQKHVVVGLVILTLILSAPVTLAQGEGVIEAQVINGTQGGGSVDGLTVTLNAFRSMTEELDALTAVADADGRVRFEGLATSPEIIYFLSATYAQVEYSTQPLSFDEGETTQTAVLTVYETAESPDEASIRVERLHLFVDFEGGIASVGEMHIFGNARDRTFVGSEEPALGQRVTLRFVLPEGAENLRFEMMGGEGDRYVTTSDGFADTTAMPPGTSQQVLFAYTLNYDDADTFDLVVPLLYPTANLNVLVPRLGLEVTSDEVDLSQISTVEGQVYLNLSGADFFAGDEVSIRFAGLQNIVRQPASAGAAKSGLDPKWIALGLAALALVGGLIYPSFRGSRKPTPVEPADARLSHLLQAIADVDDDFEAGSIDEASYRQQRQALKSEALALMREPYRS